MTTITLEVPDELAAALNQLRDRLPDLLPEVLTLLSADNGTTIVPSMRYRVFEEMIDFLASGPTPEQIAAYKISTNAQERLAELLEKNREEGLSEVENAELDVYEQVDYVMSLLMARARLAAHHKSGASARPVYHVISLLESRARFAAARSGHDASV